MLQSSYPLITADEIRGCKPFPFYQPRMGLALLTNEQHWGQPLRGWLFSVKWPWAYTHGYSSGATL